MLVEREREKSKERSNKNIRDRLLSIFLPPLPLLNRNMGKSFDTHKSPILVEKRTKSRDKRSGKFIKLTMTTGLEDDDSQSHTQEGGL